MIRASGDSPRIALSAYRCRPPPAPAGPSSATSGDDWRSYPQIPPKILFVSGEHAARSTCLSSAPERTLKWETEAANARGPRHYWGDAYAQVYISRWLEAACAPPYPNAAVSHASGQESFGFGASPIQPQTRAHGSHVPLTTLAWSMAHHGGTNSLEPVLRTLNAPRGGRRDLDPSPFAVPLTLQAGAQHQGRCKNCRKANACPPTITMKPFASACAISLPALVIAACRHRRFTFHPFR